MMERDILCAFASDRYALALTNAHIYTHTQGGKGSGTGLPCATLYVRTAIEIVVSIVCTGLLIFSDSFLLFFFLLVHSHRLRPTRHSR